MPRYGVERRRSVVGFVVLAIVSPVAVALAFASVVRGESPSPAVVLLASGLAIASVAGKGLPRSGHPHGMLAVLVAICLIAPPVALAARRSPTEAAGVVSELSTLASAVPSGLHSPGFVLNARAGSFLEGGELVRVRRHRIGGWIAAGSVALPDACWFPERVDGSDRPTIFPSRPSREPTGVRVAATDIERVCWVPSERVVVGIAPPGTRTIEAVTIAGEEVGVPIGDAGSYVILLEEGTVAANFVRISFRNELGALIDSKPVSLGEYANLAYLSDLIERPASGEEPTQRVTVSKYILTPAEFERICDTEPPHGDGFVTIAIVRRDDGTTREVVIGTGMPFSAGHPRPDPPLVRRSGGAPCFAF
ncbi:MAG: hypothetical protein ACRDJ1_04665 [Actinomycetota bacterium]